MSDSLRWRWLLAVRDDRDLSSKARLVAWALSMHMGSDGRDCRPGDLRLQDETSLSRASVRRARHELTENGWLRILERGGGRRKGGDGDPNAYLPCIPGVQAKARQPVTPADLLAVLDAVGDFWPFPPTLPGGLPRLHCREVGRRILDGDAELALIREEEDDSVELPPLDVLRASRTETVIRVLESREARRRERELRSYALAGTGKAARIAMGLSGPRLGHYLGIWFTQVYQWETRGGRAVAYHRYLVPLSVLWARYEGAVGRASADARFAAALRAVDAASDAGALIAARRH